MPANLTDISRRLTNPRPFIEALFRELGERVVADLRQNTPGERLPDEWTYSIDPSGNESRLTIFNSRLEGDREQWEVIFGYLNHGTRTHYVAPVRAQALHWTEGGQHFFSKGHIVSGILGAFFAEKADRLIADFERDVERRWQTWVETGRVYTVEQCEPALDPLGKPYQQTWQVSQNELTVQHGA